MEIDSLEQLVTCAARSGDRARMKPGIYRLADYLTDERIAQLIQDFPAGAGRPSRWMIRFDGSDNHFDFRDVILEIDTTLYAKLPYGYLRCIFVSGHRNEIHGLTIRNSGPQRGSNGNILSVFGDGNRLEDVTLHVSGSQPFGYGDLLGKGGPNLQPLEKQSGIMLAGRDNTLKRCRVISRAFGHCFYIQKPDGIITGNICLEDCYAEGITRSTADMLRETDGPLAAHQFRTIAENRDGRYVVVTGYRKSLVEDGFRSYGGTGRLTLINCTAIHTRAGFEINGPDDPALGRTLIEGGNALGCERAYLIGSNVTVRHSRGDIQYGPLLYLRGGSRSDVELELTGAGSDYTVHCLATLAGDDHRVRLFTQERHRVSPAVPILLGFNMPEHAEMASPIRRATARKIELINELPRHPVIQSDDAQECRVASESPVISESVARTLPPIV